MTPAALAQKTDVAAPSGAAAVGPDLSDVVAIAKTIHETRAQLLQETVDKMRGPRSSVWASQIPECARQGVYEFTAWNDKKLWGPDVQARINVGHYVEDATIDELKAIGKVAGFQVVDQQAKLQLEGGIHAKTDCRLEVNATRRRYVFEIKKVSAFQFEKIRDGVEGLEDLLGIWFMRKYVRQLMANMVGHNDDRGLFLLVCPDSGAWKIIPVALDRVEAEFSIAMAKTITAHVKAGTLPDRIDFDAETCGKCAFLAVCLPDVHNAPKVKFVDDGDLAAELEELKRLEPFKRQYDALWKKVKGLMQGVGETLNVGRFALYNKTSLTTKYKVPDEVKARYAVKEPQERLHVDEIGKSEGDE